MCTDQIAPTSAARKYFQECSLSYQDITIFELRYLHLLLDETFIRVAKAIRCGAGVRYANGCQKPQYWERITPAKYYKGKYDPRDGSMICAYLTAKGTYFTARGVISFYPNGWIEFCPEADSINTEPVLEAFRAWCDWLKERKISG